MSEKPEEKETKWKK